MSTDLAPAQATEPTTNTPPTCERHVGDHLCGDPAVKRIWLHQCGHALYGCLLHVDEWAQVCRRHLSSGVTHFPDCRVTNTSWTWTPA